MKSLTSNFIEQLTQNGANPNKEFYRLAKIYHPDQCKLTKKECDENMKALNLAHESLTKQN
jgi:DnaJ-class molecular chaperone